MIACLSAPPFAPFRALSRPSWSKFAALIPSAEAHELRGATVADEQLAQAWTLKGATLPNGTVPE